jgi:hypothetical protein
MFSWRKDALEGCADGLDWSGGCGASCSVGEEVDSEEVVATPTVKITNSLAYC